MASQHVHPTTTTFPDAISVSTFGSQSSQSSPEELAGRKSFHSVDIREVKTVSTSQSNGRWSNISGSTVQRLPERLSEKTRINGKVILKKEHISKTSSWTFELFSLAVAFGAVASIIGVLAHFDGRALPSWPYDITLNALIALLATVANATMAVPLSSGLSQLKWIRFKTGRAPLTDMEVFDEASRGTLGALKLLLKLRGGIFGSFGAIIAIIALTLGPFSQQIATYHAHTVTSPVGASIPRALNYTAALSGNTDLAGFVPILPLKAAVYNGLFAENGKPGAALPVTCQTGNCTWKAFDTLAVCNQCVDMSAYMMRYCADGVPEDGNTTSCGWQLPDGAKLNSSAEVFSMTSLFPTMYDDMPYSTIMKLIFMGTESQSGIAGVLEPWATQCTLQACIQTISASVVNGEVIENVTSTTLNSTVTTSSSGTLDPVIVSSGDNSSYPLSMEAMIGMRSWFAELFTNGSASRNSEPLKQTITDAAVVVNLTVGISSGQTFFDTDIVQAFYWNYYEYPTGINMLMSDLAVSMTTSFRSFTGAVPVQGVALMVESFVHVRWGFITVPVLAVLLTAFFLSAAMYRSWRSGARLWKSSALAMLFHGLDDETREKFEAPDDLHVQKRQARDVKVQLDESGSGGSLLRM